MLQHIHTQLSSRLPTQCPTITQVTTLVQRSAQRQSRMSRHIVCDALIAVNAVPLTSDPIVKTHLPSSSRHMHRTLRTLRTSSFPRLDTIAVTVRRTAALTTEPLRPLVQPTLGVLRL
jgi:hypothetical protein